MAAIEKPRASTARPEQKNRLTYIDTAKCIGVFIVVWGHSAIPVLAVRQAISAFLIPLFFVLSGFVASTAALPARKWPGFVLRRATGLLVPAWVFSLIFFYTIEMPVQNLLDVLLGYSGSLAQMWFLPCMFLSVLAYQGLMNAAGPMRGWLRAVFFSGAGLVFFSVALLFNTVLLPAKGLPFSLNVSFMGVALMLAGRGLRLLLDNWRPLRSLAGRAAAFLLCAGLGLYTVFLNRPALDARPLPQVDMDGGRYGNPLLFFATALLLCLAVILLAGFIDNRAFAFVGRNTLVVLCLHVLMLELLRGWVNTALAPENSLVLSLCYALGALLLTLPFVWVLNLLAPNLVGKQAVDRHP